MRPAPVHGHVYVELWPAGGYAVRMAGVAAPVSRHDTEQEALDRAARYQRGLEDAAARGEAANSSPAAFIDDTVVPRTLQAGSPPPARRPGADPKSRSQI